MAKPTEVPGWDPDDDDVIEPNAGKKLAGWAPGERPPAQTFNFFWRSVSRWIDYLDEGDLEVGEVYHGDRKLIISPASFIVHNGPSGVSIGAFESGLSSSAEEDAAAVPINLRAGDRVKDIILYFSSVAGTPFIDFYRVPRAAPGSPVSVASENVSAGEVPLGPGIDHTILEDSSYAVVIESSGAGDTALVSYVEVIYDRPAP
jgi:hypothetical protein